ncbi:Nucleoporin [Cercospora beticola]|uniref:Nucleoporin n=1 Tax=Cercospora beticola TaxID=122368 RepID=A0A2G5I394_CERBT|nr:Nucleoporin [Cercospora beticola]PIA99250.1 Nucleoporin [Cercospora beticola]WPB00047.1 hypothetical protein RHO25_004666 [Cercospora beticola]CAK1361773.1 unnamed protein product [Cercospora beticola]
MATEDPLLRLQILQRDLVAATDSQLRNITRLSDQLDASVKDLENLLKRTRKNDTSRNIIKPTTSPPTDTITVDDVEYRVREEFRDAAIAVANELDLDEVEAAKLCIQAQIDGSAPDASLPLRAMVRFHEQRATLLDCMRLLLQLGIDTDAAPDEEQTEAFREVGRKIVEGRGQKGNEEKRPDPSAYWRACVDGLGDIENLIKKMADDRERLAVTELGASPDRNEALRAQRYLLTRQHEFLAAIMSYLIRGSFVQPEDYRIFLSKASTSETEVDITIHYLPILISGASHIGSEGVTSPEVARDLHKLFTPGNTQLQWKQPMLRAAATVCWLAEYSSRFMGNSHSANQSSATRKAEEEARTKLFFDSLKDKAFHFILAAAAFLKPVAWYDPSRTGIVDFLVDGAVSVVEMPRASNDFSVLTMRELQAFADAFVTNMPDCLRKLKLDEDEMRRTLLSQSGNGQAHSELDLERFMVIMACAYQDDAEAAHDFWADKESNLYGFLRWVSVRLPTPRVAAFCQLLRSIACDDKSADQAHRFLLEDAGMVSGKLRKTYAVSWTQIFSELELYSTGLKNRPAAVPAPGQERTTVEDNFEEPETGIMLDSYLSLASHICRSSPEARNWLLKDQPFHLGEVMFQLARTATIARVRACCLDLLAALLTDKVLEVRNGMWVLLDSWIASAGLDGSHLPRTQPRIQYPAKQYLQAYANNAEAGAALLALLNALVSPFSTQADMPVDNLPFPENLGSPHRHAGIEIYVDFVMDAVLARKVPRMPAEGELSLLTFVRYECLHFTQQCLSSFNEDLVLLANTTSVAVESAMETKSLATYARLHPFARVMEWLFDKNVIASVFAAAQQNLDTLDHAEPTSPIVRATVKAIQILNLAWKMQPTYFDIVRPIVAGQNTTTQRVTSSTLSSIDDAFLTHLDAVIDIAQFTSSKHPELSLESTALLQRIASSRKICESREPGMARSTGSNRLIGLLAPLSEDLTLSLQANFHLLEWDLETEDIPPKMIKAKSLLDSLRASLDAANGKPCLAHCLLGFQCYERTVGVADHSAFGSSKALFHAIARCAVEMPVISGPSGYRSWLLSVKRGCLELLLRLATSTLTERIVQPELRSMDFLAALSRSQAPASTHPCWDGKTTLEPSALLDSSATAIRDFMHSRESFFEYAAFDLRAAVEQGAFSVQERIVSSMLGSIRLSNGEELPTSSIFELFDFFDVETVPALEPNYTQCTVFGDIDLSSCTKDDRETVVAFDLNLAHQLLILRKRELKENGTLKEAADFDKASDEISAILASLTSQNNWRAIHAARVAALESWTELLSLIVTKGGLDDTAIVPLSLQGLLLVLPKYEKSLADDMEAAGLLAKLTLTFTIAISPASRDSSQQTANVANERLLTIFRISLKVLTDSSTDPALRDVAYRTSCTILGNLSASTTSTNAKQLYQLAQNAGDRLLTVVTEDAFSGRGVTRVSALLFLDSMVSLHQGLKLNTPLLRALLKLNFIPVLIDMSIGSVSAAFHAQEEVVTTLAYFHTALALMLRLCQTPDGTQLVLNSGFFSAVDDSKLFSTDPDIGLDIDNPSALEEFYSILTDILRVIVAAVVSKGSQPGTAFLQQHRYTVQAIFKQASRGHAVKVANELSRLILATDFLEDDEAATGGASRNGFT